MRVLMANSFYYLRGGVERHFFDLTELLANHGHQVIPFCMQHERNMPSEYAPYFTSFVDFPSLMGQKTSLATRLQVIERVIYSRQAQEKIEKLVQDTQPDIVHVQEIDHEISPSILDTVKRFNLPVVMTLHDYKMLCPNTNFISHGEVCERCAGSRFYHTLLRRCKRDAFLPSLLASMEAYFQKLSRIYLKNVDLFVTPSQFLQRKLVEYGFRSRTVQLPNFVSLDRFQPAYGSSDYFVFFGRLVALKGVRTLFEAMRHIKPGARLYVAGEGELRDELGAFAQQNGLSQITFLGHLETSELVPLVQGAAFTVFPSECYENYPMAILESMACGKPVIGSRIGGIPELIQEGQTGLLFEPGNAHELAEKIQWLLDRPERTVEMGYNSRRQVETINCPQLYYQQIIELYQDLLLNHQGGDA